MDHPYKFGDTVIADDSGISMMVTGFEYRPTQIFVQCAYWLDGKAEEIWLPLWRTSAAES